MKLNNSRGERTDISAEKEALMDIQFGSGDEQQEPEQRACKSCGSCELQELEHELVCMHCGCLIEEIDLVNTREGLFENGGGTWVAEDNDGSCVHNKKLSKATSGAVYTPQPNYAVLRDQALKVRVFVFFF